MGELPHEMERDVLVVGAEAGGCSSGGQGCRCGAPLRPCAAFLVYSVEAGGASNTSWRRPGTYFTTAG